MFSKACSTKNKGDQAANQHSIAVAIATATTTATASSRVSVAKKGGGGRPCLDSKLAQHPLNHTTFTTFITSTTTAAAAISTTAAAATAIPITIVATPTPTKKPPTTEPTSTKTAVIATTTTESNDKALAENQLEDSLPEDAPATVAEGRGQRPRYDSALAHDSLSQPIFDAAPAIVLTTATSTMPNDTEPTTMSTVTEGGVTELGKNQFEIILLDILLNIAVLLLSSRDFANLSQTCQYVRRSLDNRWVWHQRFLLRLGKALLLSLLNPRHPETDELLAGRTMPTEDTTVVSKELLKEWYRTYTRMAVPPKEMGISHIKNDQYWKYVDDPRCFLGQAATLKSGLWWLNIRGILFGVLPGRYWVQWGLGLKNASSVVGTQFRVAPFSNDEVPEWGNDAENCIDYTPYTFRDFLHHTLMTNKDAVSSEEAIIFQLPRVLVVEQEKSTVFVQMREHNREKNGLTVLFVRIIPAGDDEEDVKAEREQVEGEEDVMVDDEDDDQWTDEEYNAFEEVGEHGFGWSYGDEEEEEEEEELEGEEGDSDIAAEDAEDGGDNEGDAGEGAEGGFEFEGGLFNLLNYAGGGFGSLNGGGHAGGESSSYSLPYNNTQEDDGNARPYCFRSPR